MYDTTIHYQCPDNHPLSVSWYNHPSSSVSYNKSCVYRSSTKVNKRGNLGICSQWNHNQQHSNVKIMFSSILEQLYIIPKGILLSWLLDQSQFSTHFLKSLTTEHHHTNLPPKIYTCTTNPAFSFHVNSLFSNITPYSFERLKIKSFTNDYWTIVTRNICTHKFRLPNKFFFS